MVSALCAVKSLLLLSLMLRYRTPIRRLLWIALSLLRSPVTISVKKRLNLWRSALSAIRRLLVSRAAAWAVALLAAWAASSPMAWAITTTAAWAALVANPRRPLLRTMGFRFRGARARIRTSVQWRTHRRVGRAPARRRWAMWLLTRASCNTCSGGSGLFGPAAGLAVVCMGCLLCGGRPRRFGA